MPKFSALSITDLFTAERDAGRVARGVRYIVASEASDGSWCEFDGESFGHALRLADNAVDNLGARGASVWFVGTEGQCINRLYLAFPVLGYATYGAPHAA